MSFGETKRPAAGKRDHSAGGNWIIFRSSSQSAGDGYALSDRFDWLKFLLLAGWSLLLGHFVYKSNCWQYDR